MEIKMDLIVAVYENWGIEKPVAADVWVKTGVGHRIEKHKADTRS